MSEFRDPLALAMIAAWLNVRPEQVPTEWRVHTCEQSMRAWQRVADAAREFLATEASLPPERKARIEREFG